MNEAERDVVRKQVRADTEKFLVAFAPQYLGKFCPLIKGECEGPNCVFFLLQQNEQGKIAGGACSIPLIASQVGPIAAGLESLAFQVAEASGAAPKIVEPPAGLIR